MENRPLYTRIFFEMLDVVAVVYQDATHEKIAKPFTTSLQSKLSEFVDNKIAVMRLDIDRAKAVREELGMFKEYLIHRAIPDNTVKLSHLAYQKKIMKIDGELKTSIIERFDEYKESFSYSTELVRIERIQGTGKELVGVINLQIIAIQQKIDEISEFRPNDPDQIAFKNDQVLFLSRIRDSLTVVSALKSQSKASPDAVGVLEALVTWWNQHNQKVIGWGISLPAAAVGISILQMAGVPIAASIAALTAIAGGSKVSDIIKDMKDK